MDEASIAGNLNQAVTEASGSVHFHEHFNLLGDRVVLEYHFTQLPDRINLERIRAAFEKVEALYWSRQHGHETINLDGLIVGEKVSLFISLRKESV